MAGLVLQLLHGEYAVGRLSASVPVPAWAGAGAFSSITRTADELSVICSSAQFPSDQPKEAGWRLVKFAGPFDFGAVGILASVVQPLAGAGISVLTVGTFDTDYVLIKSTRLADAFQVLGAAGHTVHHV